MFSSSIASTRQKLAYDYKILLTESEKITINAKNRRVYDCNPALAGSLYKQLCGLKLEINNLRGNLNSISRKLSKASSSCAATKNYSNTKDSPSLMSTPVSEIPYNSTCKNLLQEEAKTIKILIKEKNAQLLLVEEQLINEAVKIPNTSHPLAPVGDETKAIVVESFGNLLSISNKNDAVDAVPKAYSSLEYKDNADLCESLGIADFQSAAKVSGSRFHYWKRAGVLLELGLIQYTMKSAMEFGFIPYTTPELVRSSIVDGCGFRPRSTHNSNTETDHNTQNNTNDSVEHTPPEPSQIYRVAPVAKEELKDYDDPLCLIATAEIPLTAMYSEQILYAKSRNLKSETAENNQSNYTEPKYGWFGNGKKFAEYAQWANPIINIDLPNYSNHTDKHCNSSNIDINKLKKLEKISDTQLPIGLVGLSHCFRSEAGSRGRDTRGLYRLHQFSKVELVILTTPQDSDDALDFLISFQRSICKDLGLTYRILDMPTAELGASASRKFDIEVYMPGRGSWGEVSSASNCTDYQSRRLDIRFRSDKSEILKGAKPTQFAHSLNATACAIPRMVAAIIETYQQKDGSVKIPDALLPYMFGLKVIY
ncbi:hypothetical protein BB561_000594 [Smittium simulii]|uniref:serine--tRNA ligase n=1 Tax=Smittium simulii TaxID=133385 RepID=A0A2T9YYI1_9FUNG|nr:hypothetical protein BB561_000594 [Smittium simulii]